MNKVKLGLKADMRKITKFFAALIIGLFMVSPSFAGGGIEWGEAPPDSVSPWSLEWRGALNGSQASYRNWEQGGVNTLSVTAQTNFNALYRKNKWGYKLNIGLMYGQARIGDDYRKTDDEIKVRNTVRYFLEDERWSVVGSAQFLSQFDEGLDRNQEFTVSRFMSPAYITETLGISFQPTDYFTAEFGAAAKQTIVLDEGFVGAEEDGNSVRQRYGLRPDESVRNELGFSFRLEFDKEIFENVRYISSLETFSNAQRNPDRSDFTFNNEVIGRINDYLNTTFRFTMLYNDDVSDKLQLRQTLTVGLSFSLI